MYVYTLLSISLAGCAAAQPMVQLDRRATSAVTCTAVSPTPSNTICGQLGTLSQTQTYQNITNYQIVSSLSACTNLVAPPLGSSYASFAYNKVSGLCTFYADYPGADGATFVPNANGNTVYYQNTCFNCVTNCPLTGAGNLLGDPGFELSNQYVGPWITESFSGYSISTFPSNIVVTSPGSNSSNCLNMQASGSENRLIQYIPYCKYSTYSFTMDYKVTTAGSSGSAFDVLLPDGSAPFLQTTSTKGFVTYQDLFYFQKNYNNEINQLSVNTYSNGGTLPNVFLDNFGISEISAGAPQPAAGSSSLVPNGSFQSGKLGPWTYTDMGADSYAIVSPGLNGSKYKFQFTASSSGDSFTLAQTLTLTKGTQYYFSADFAGSVSSAIIYIGNRYMYYGPSTTPINGTDTYVNAFIAQTNSVTFNMTVQESTVNGANVAYVDNITVQPLAS